MLKHLLVLTCALLASSSALAQVMARDLGDFELKLATSPTRSMAQGLVTPGSSGSFHGGSRPKPRKWLVHRQLDLQPRPRQAHRDRLLRRL